MTRAAKTRALQALRWSLHAAGLACLVVIGCIAVRTHWAISAEHGRLERLATSNARLVANADSLRGQREQTVNDVQQLADRLNALRLRNPQLPHEAEFLALLGQSAEQFGIKLQGFRPGPITAHSDGQEIELQLQISAVYPALCRFLDHLKELPRACRVQHVVIAAPIVAGEPCTVELKLGLLFGTNTQLTSLSGKP